MLSEKKLQFGILLLYGVSLSHLVWTGTMYQYIGSVMAPFEVVACIVLWVLIVMSVFSLRKKEPDHVHDPWLQGILFAAFALPPATYLITTLIGW
ncbi:MAG: DUF1980 domain-containing protein [Acidibacillus sp.]|uniref:DUF1980 domain-containing protein n=1 Tax=Sulfoacidibacillus ferrooxidans TaxID=2005001 RepID=A0A9X1V9I0_9BACL|nr:DUF1980 domain-containing protein [Sulfoacidibacillus ferrooxidans]MCI0183719.1 hypothetical protein [Sulfoacidibacillus ferrooxidans]MCY0892241.1 DUF1980 domain-containing protein [Acidibacillus sp.]